MCPRQRHKPPADQHTQAKLGRLGAFGLFKLALPDVDGKRRACHCKRIGGLGPGLQGGIQQGLGHSGKIGHGLSFQKRA